jgi:exo-1,4-beta-D-glucosaminidase
MNDTWGYHDAATGNGRYDKYYHEMVKRYGEPLSMEDFSDKMQLMNATGYQGMFEAGLHILNNNGGVMLWKLNAAFPSVIWQIYDWYLMPNAGFYFMQNACEPLHIQLNLNDSVVAVVNRKHKSITGLSAEAFAYSIKTELLFKQSSTLDIGPDEVKETPVSLVPFLKKGMGISFIVLRLKDAAGNILSRNIYWMEKTNDFKRLQQMPRAMIQAKLLDQESGKDSLVCKILLTNTSKQLAFFVRLQLMNKNEEVLPSIWSSNYLTLAPGESNTVMVSVPPRIGKDLQPEVRISGWNVEPRVIPVRK